MARVRMQADGGEPTWRRADHDVVLQVDEGSSSLVLLVDTAARRLRIEMAHREVADLSWADLLVAIGHDAATRRRLYPLTDEQAEAVLAAGSDVLIERIRDR